MKKKKSLKCFELLNIIELEHITGGIPYKKPVVLEFGVASAKDGLCIEGIPCNTGIINGITCKGGYGCGAGLAPIQ